MRLSLLQKSVMLAGAMFVTTTVLAMAPNFSPALYGDGELWGTKFTTVLPAPNGNNSQSFDKLFVFVEGNAAPGQLPVSEAAPGNPGYNGGRWFTHTVMWEAGSTPTVLKSYEDIILYRDSGQLMIFTGNDGTPTYFQCPLLPVK